MLPYLYPRQTVLITARERIKSKFAKRVEEKEEIYPTDWHMLVSQEPPIYAFTAAKDSFILKLVETSRCFGVNFLGHQFDKKIVLECGRKHGEHLNKFSEFGLDKIDGRSVDCPLLKEAIGILECEVINLFEIGGNILVAGQILRGEGKRGKRLIHLGREKFTTIK